MNMNPVVRPRSYGASRDKSGILSRLMSSMPAGTFEMETFSRLAGVVASKDVPTAAMECKHRPRLLINPEFVQKHCKRDEHLFLLVMHELWHVMLAHTSLFPRITQAQNIAFDAIINAGLMRQFDKPVYRGFFEELNPADKFPHLLLRPPVGWPENPQYPDDTGPEGTARILRQLYPPAGPFRPTMPYYEEILDLIKQDLKEKGLLIEVPVLLGDHDSQNPYDNTFLKDAMGRVSRKWPMSVGSFGPPGQGGHMDDWMVDPYSATQELRRAFSYVLRRALGNDLGEYRRKERMPIPGITGKGVLPNPRDRLTAARKRLGFPNTLWEQQGTYKARVPDRKVRAHVYLDVSGSMSEVLPHMLGLLLPYVYSGKANVFQFSTEVDALPLRSLRKGLVRTTGGTQINCVMNHLAEHEESVRRVLILTDGYTGRPFNNHIQRVRENNMKIHVVLPGESPYEHDLQSIADSFTVLPRLR